MLLRAAQGYRLSPFKLYRQCRQLKRSHRFAMGEILGQGFLEPPVNWAELNRYISLETLYGYQEKLSEGFDRDRLLNKIRLAQALQQHNLPHPRQLFTYNPYGGDRIDRATWTAQLLKSLPKTCIIKPAYGMLGHGVRALTRGPSDDLFTDNFGKKVSANDLYDYVSNDAAYEAFLFQERLTNHPTIQELTGTTALQTLRIITLYEADGTLTDWPTHFRMITGRSVTDNMDRGRNQRSVCSIDATTGSIEQGWVFRKHNIGFDPMPHHPVTGRELSGFRFPDWEAARALARTAAEAFLPCRTVGWDIALTPDGPVIIEGNLYYHPPIRFAAKLDLLDRIRDCVGVTETSHGQPHPITTTSS